MMNMHSAGYLRDELEPRLPEHEVTAVPWKHEDGEWVVTVWENGLVVADIFEVNPGKFMLRKVGLGAEIGCATVAEIPALVRTVKV